MKNSRGLNKIIKFINSNEVSKKHVFIILCVYLICWNFLLGVFLGILLIIVYYRNTNELNGVLLN